MLEELQLYGWRPFIDEPDPRPLPEPDAIRTAVADIFDALVSTLSDTRLEPDLEDLLWSTTKPFSTAWRPGPAANSTATNRRRKRAQREQDGSEVRSVELETLIAEGITLIERRNAFEAMRDLAAEGFEAHLGQTWHPRTGSHVNRRTLTASLIDSRDHIAAKRRADLEPLLPQGTKIAFSGGLDCTDHTAIWAALDRVHTKHADMVLLHGGRAARGRTDRRRLGRQPRRDADRLQNPTGRGMANRPPLQAQTTSCSTPCPSASSSSRAPASPKISLDKARTMGIPLFDFRPKAAPTA